MEYCVQTAEDFRNYSYLVTVNYHRQYRNSTHLQFVVRFCFVYMTMT